MCYFGHITLFLQGLLTMFTKCCYNLSIDKNVKKLEYVFFPFTMLLCPDLLFSLLKRNTDDSFFFVLSFLNLSAQVRCPQNQYTDFKFALQPLTVESLEAPQTINF